METSHSLPWVSFCISTYKRRDFLLKQLNSLLQQTFPAFEIVVSDNDPDASAEAVVSSLGDKRIKYYHNGDNIGMIGSFNKSIERASTDFIVMVTDDDPVNTDFLSTMFDLWVQKPGHGIYGGFQRKNSPHSSVEVINAENFISEILDPGKTPNMLWSSCVLNRGIVVTVGGIPDYGSPHLADHALIALIGDRAGAVIMNKMYSSLSSHDSNYSKANFEYYRKGCEGFYATMQNNIRKENLPAKKSAIDKHLQEWLIANIYTLKRYYSVVSPNEEKLGEINLFAREIVRLPFMRKIGFFMLLKEVVFRIKIFTGILRKKKSETF